MGHRDVWRGDTAAGLGSLRSFSSLGLTPPSSQQPPNKCPHTRGSVWHLCVPNLPAWLQPPRRDICPRSGELRGLSPGPRPHGVMLTSEIECRGEGLVHGDADPVGTQRGKLSASKP